MQPEAVSAFVLHARPFKENQALLEVLMAGEGRISLITYKGGKKNSAKSALLQPFRPIAIQVKKDSGLRKLLSIEEDKALPLASVNLKGRALYCGFYLNEIICRLCPADAYFPDLYLGYTEALRQLARLEPDSLSYEANLQLILRRFEYRLLVLLGYGIDFYSDAESGQAITAEQDYLLLPESGFVALGLNTTEAKNSLPGELVMRVAVLLNEDESPGVNPGLIQNFIQSGGQAECRETSQTYGDAEQTSENLAEIKSSLAAAKFILMACLHRHLGDKPLKSRELFRTR